MSNLQYHYKFWSCCSRTMFPLKEGKNTDLFQSTYFLLVLLYSTVSKGVPNIKAVSPNVTLTQLGGNSTLRCHVSNAFSVDAIPIWSFDQNCNENITNYREHILPREIWEGSQATIELHLVNISQAHLGCYKCCIRELQDDWLADEALVQRCQTLLIQYRRNGEKICNCIHDRSFVLLLTKIYKLKELIKHL